MIKSINISYAIYFNRKYRSKYIHSNPVKSGMVKEPEHYEWSSYRVYNGQKQDFENIIDTSKILGCFSNKKGKAIKEYVKYVKSQEETKTEIMDIDYDRDSTRNYCDYMESVEQIIDKVGELGEKEGITFKQILKDKDIRNRMIRIIRKNSTLTLKEIGEVFGGLSESTISKILKNSS